MGGVNMPFSIEQYKDQDLTVIFMTGNIPPGELLEALKAFYDGSPTADVIWDFREVTGGVLTAEDIREIFDCSMENLEKRQSGRTAFVAPADYEYGLARMTSTIGELRDVPWELQAFRSVEDATRWLDVQYPVT
jgi:hypothetical protein